MNNAAVPSFHDITKHFITDGSIEGAGSHFTTKGPIRVAASDFQSMDKVTVCVHQTNGVSPATGYRTYPGKARERYSVLRGAPIIACSHGFANSNAWPTVDGNDGVLIEPDQPLTFFKQ